MHRKQPIGSGSFANFEGLLSTSSGRLWRLEITGERVIHTDENPREN